MVYVNAVSLLPQLKTNSGQMSTALKRQYKPKGILKNNLLIKWIQALSDSGLKTQLEFVQALFLKEGTAI